MWADFPRTIEVDCESLSAFITPDQMTIITSNMSRYRKVIGLLIFAIFTKEELMGCSLTGEKTNRPPLDKIKVDAITGKFIQLNLILFDFNCFLSISAFMLGNYDRLNDVTIRARIGKKLRDSWKLGRNFNWLKNYLHAFYFLNVLTGIFNKMTT